ncbi:hypothetical protein AA106555_0862 [Neokomagataea thailandica NBRC 106555]|uniref:Transposase n=1 Tax=Neokomagataea thailandica NBRC 106555 TaxID=1223520 RepID=A0ABQ0QPB8_9PROT|nr:hypothetical protein AA106555_0862 [Neokomagataea thailandica NBRC 106555]
MRNTCQDRRTLRYKAVYPFTHAVERNSRLAHLTRTLWAYSASVPAKTKKLRGMREPTHCTHLITHEYSGNHEQQY